MNDILPPKRPLSQPPRTQPSDTSSVKRPVSVTPPSEPLLEPPRQPLLLQKPKRRVRKVIIWIVAGCVALLLAAGIAGYLVYTSLLAAVNPSDNKKTSVHIASGSSPSQIGQNLEEKGLIRSGFAFEIYVRLSGVRAKLQAGTYSLSPSESTQQIVEHLTSGNVDQLTITFLPGATLAENRKKLLEVGYEVGEVDAALAKTYESPLFASKPATADLEGYIYGETYAFAHDVTVEDILQRTFDEFYAAIEENGLMAGFEKQGLTLYEAITLASIIQREVPDPQDQKQVAQVFLHRLSLDMNLGSDVTYQYAAKKQGLTPSPDLDSPYNTRKYGGLPPGPISSPGLSALQAVADPAEGDYTYFLSGDNDVTYFARTNEEQEANIRDHCQVKCALP